LTKSITKPFKVNFFRATLSPSAVRPHFRTIAACPACLGRGVWFGSFVCRFRFEQYGAVKRMRCCGGWVFIARRVAFRIPAGAAAAIPRFK